MIPKDRTDCFEGVMTSREEHAKCIDHATWCGWDPDDEESIAHIDLGCGCCHESHYLTPEQALPVMRAIVKRTWHEQARMTEQVLAITAWLNERDTRIILARLHAAEETTDDKG